MRKYERPADSSTNASGGATLVQAAGTSTCSAGWPLLKERIMAGIEEVNRYPVIHTWSYKLAEAA